MSKASDPALYESGFDRIPKDRYWTENWLTQILLRRFDLSGLPKPIWEPCAGRGDMVKALQDNGCNVFASDIDMSEFDAGECKAVQSDFLKEPVPAELLKTGFSAIVTNPPYDRAEEVIWRALELEPEIVAMLLRSEFNQADGRSAMFKDPQYMFAAEIVVTTRPRWDWFFRDKPVASPRHGFSWFVWDRGQFEYHPTQFWEGKEAA